MARIQEYTIDTVLSDADKIIGTDADDSNKTVNFTIGDLKTYINASTPIPECFIGKNSAALNFTGVETLQTIVFTAANNANNTSSYHLGTAPAVLQNTAGVIENTSGSQIIVKVEFSCAINFSGGNAEVIYYLQKSVNSGATWTNEEIVTRSNSGGGSIAQHSFWFIELLNSGELLRVQMAGSAGEQLNAFSAVSFAVKAPGNII
tara:strand:- start:17 stop:631 length:615 start_codon:yes stop_codon:yes gene_type:complete